MGIGDCWIPLLSVEGPFLLSSFLIALCIDISVEDRGDFSGDSVHSLIFLWCSLYFFSSFFSGRCLLWGVVGRIVCWDRPFPICLFQVIPFDLSLSLLSSLSSPLSSVLLLYFFGLFLVVFTYVHLYNGDPTPLSIFCTMFVIL